MVFDLFDKNVRLIMANYLKWIVFRHGFRLSVLPIRHKDY